MTELDSAQAAVTAARDRLAAANAALEAQRTIVAGLRSQLEAGAADVLETLQAESEQAAAELTRWEARVGLARAQGRLEDAVQAPFPAMAAAVASAGSSLIGPTQARTPTSSGAPTDTHPRATAPSRR
jgi:outer membrane protein TolC